MNHPLLKEVADEDVEISVAHGVSGLAKAVEHPNRFVAVAAVLEDLVGQLLHSVVSQLSQGEVLVGLVAHGQIFLDTFKRIASFHIQNLILSTNPRDCDNSASICVSPLRRLSTIS